MGAQVGPLFNQIVSAIAPSLIVGILIIDKVLMKNK